MKEIKMFDLDRQYILMSALQKAIRWCEVDEARSFAKDLMDMDSQPTLVFNRLLTIAAEDVGLADPSLILYVRKLYDEFDNKRKQNGIKKADAFNFPDLREIVDRAVIAAAISYKSRLTAMATGATLYDIYQNETFKENPSIYLSRLADTVKNRDEKQALYYAFVAGIFLNLKDRISIFIRRQGEDRNDYLIQGWAEEYKRDSEKMVLAGCVVMLCRPLSVTHGEYENAIDQHFSTPINKAQIPDRAYDKHTRKGENMDRGLKNFFKVAATVKNERFPNYWQKTGENAYYSAERKGFKKTKMLIKAIKTKYEKAQQSTAIHNPLTI
jgi:replication-associated recombination protein RarA